jgi:hypothetical protein
VNRFIDEADRSQGILLPETIDEYVCEENPVRVIDAFVGALDPALSEARSNKRKPMATSLYDLSVPTFLQTVKAVGGFLDRAARHCAETRADPNDFVLARLFDDMAPFHFQIEAAWHHSVWGLEAVKTGVFGPPALVGPVPFADLRAMISKAETALEAFTPDEVNS